MNSYYTSIDPNYTADFIITWDTGKRCNFDCSYCGSDRHDNTSVFPSFNKLVKGVDFIKEYLKIIMPYRKNKNSGISLTGGEPTTNPNFLKFVKYLNDSFEDFEFNVNTNLTTNGSFTKKYIPEICKNVNSLSLSYHCDSKEEIKDTVRNNILIIGKTINSFKVNLMMHPYNTYWKECLNLIDIMEKNNIKYIPRVINGLEYSKDQAEWLKNYWQNKNNATSRTKIDTKLVNTFLMATEKVYKNRYMKQDVAHVYKNLKNDPEKKYTIDGRHCCNKVLLNCKLLENDIHENQTYVSDIRFPDWYCGVNWFFLHLESQTDNIYHHQTCQAKFGKDKGPVGNMLDNGEMKIIRCPNNKCGCGLCATKSKSFIDFTSAINKHTIGIKYAI